MRNKKLKEKKKEVNRVVVVLDGICSYCYCKVSRECLWDFKECGAELNMSNCE